VDEPAPLDSRILEEIRGLETIRAARIVRV
jgi:hypothetical protein